MSDKIALARAQAFNATIVRYIYALIETTKKLGTPGKQTLIKACETALREAHLAGASVEPALPPDYCLEVMNELDYAQKVQLLTRWAREIDERDKAARLATQAYSLFPLLAKWAREAEDKESKK